MKSFWFRIAAAVLFGLLTSAGAVIYSEWSDAKNPTGVSRFNAALVNATTYGAKDDDTTPVLTVRDVCAKKKTTIVHLFTTWCGYCKKFHEEVLPDAAVKERLQTVEFVGLDAEKNVPLAQELGVQGVPATFALNTKCEVTGKLVGYVPAPQFVQWLNEVDPQPVK